MEIKVGEYVRTEDGYIGIFDRYSKRPNTSIYKCPFDCFIKLRKRKTPLQCGREYIVNHSFNIIDLIEAGDIVFIEDFFGYNFIHVFDESMLEALKKDVKDGIKIKTILTHEQYERNCYRLENN